MLHQDVRTAVRQGKFNIYPVRQVTEVMQLLSGMQPGRLDDKGQFPKKSFNYRIQHRIDNLRNIQRKLTQRAPADDSPSAEGNEA
jgi:predicted ATP-dependent protease